MDRKLDEVLLQKLQLYNFNDYSPSLQTMLDKYDYLYLTESIVTKTKYISVMQHVLNFPDIYDKPIEEKSSVLAEHYKQEIQNYLNTLSGNFIWCLDIRNLAWHAIFVLKSFDKIDIIKELSRVEKLSVFI